MGLNNTPSPVIRNRLRILTETLLDPLRAEWEARCKVESWGNPAIIVTSGYRSAELNRAVGGASTSAHLLGWAADLKPQNGRLHDFKNCCRSFLATRDFDQLISESEDAAGIPFGCISDFTTGRTDNASRCSRCAAVATRPFYKEVSKPCALRRISPPSGVTR